MQVIKMLPSDNIMEDFQQWWKHSSDRVCAVAELLIRWKFPPYLVLIMLVSELWPRWLMSKELAKIEANIAEYKSSLFTGHFIDQRRASEISIDIDGDEALLLLGGEAIGKLGSTDAGIKSFSIHWSGAIGYGGEYEALETIESLARDVAKAAHGFLKDAPFEWVEGTLKDAFNDEVGGK